MKKRKLKTLDLATKIRLIAEVEKGTRIKKHIAEEFGIPSNTLSTIWGAREKIKLQYKSLSYGNNVKRKKRFCHLHVENLVLQWLRTKRYSVSAKIIKQKATEFAKTLNIKRFEANDNWLKRISRIRNKINIQHLSKESEAGEQTAGKHCQEIQPTLVADFEIVEIESLPQEVNKKEDESFDDSTHTVQNSHLNNTEVFSELNHHGQPQEFITEETVEHQLQGDSESESEPEEDQDECNNYEHLSVMELKPILMRNQIKLLKVQIAAAKEQKKAAKAQRRAAVVKTNLNQYQLLLLQRNSMHEKGVFH